MKKILQKNKFIETNYHLLLKKKILFVIQSSKIHIL